MNFKPLENERQYKYTKEMIGELENHIEHFIKEYKDSSNFWLFTKQTIYAKNIMEAEVQDYEHRKRGNYELRFKGG